MPNCPKSCPVPFTGARIGSHRRRSPPAMWAAKTNIAEASKSDKIHSPSSSHMTYKKFLATCTYPT